jgi:hypothetical protein
MIPAETKRIRDLDGDERAAGFDETNFGAGSVGGRERKRNGMERDRDLYVLVRSFESGREALCDSRGIFVSG